jgi:hypothetical protein
LQTDTALDEVFHIAADPGRRVYALMDGAQFDDLPDMLMSVGLSHRSLYRNVQDAELVRTGPWLVNPYCKPDPALNVWGGLPPAGRNAVSSGNTIAADSELALTEPVSAGDELSGLPLGHNDANPLAQLELVAGVAGGAPAAVFWIGDAGLTETSLWRHLRTLNMVLIPKGYGEAEAPPPADGDETHDAVLFRHGDGNVLAEVLPMLDETQFSRVFGPARALVFLAPDHPAADGSILRRALLPGDAPPAPPGMLKLSMDQMEGIEVARLERSRQKVIEYLRDVDNEATLHMSDAELRKAIVQYELSGNALGLRSERAHMKWAYLMSVSDGDIVKRPETRQYFHETSKHPDDRIDDLLDMFDGVWAKPGHDA